MSVSHSSHQVVMQLAQGVEGAGLSLDSWVIYAVVFPVLAVAAATALMLLKRKRQQNTFKFGAVSNLLSAR